MNGAARGSFVLLVAMIIATSLNYAFTVGMGWLLGPEEYGIFGVSMAFLLLLGFLVQSGFPQTAAKFLSEEREDKLKILRTSLLGNLLIGFAVGAIFYLVMRIVNLGADYDSIMLVLALTVLIGSFAYVCYGALQGLFRFKNMGAFHVLDAVIKLLFGFSLVLLGFGALGAVLGMAIGTFFALALALFWLRDTRFWRGRGLASLDIYKFAAPMFFGTLPLVIFMNIDILGVRFLTASDELTGYYQATITLARIPVWVILGVMGAAFPFISKYAEGELAKVYVRIPLKYSLLFLVPISIALMAAPEPLLYLFFPQEYLVASSALVIVSLGMIFLVIINILARSFQALGHPRIPALFLLPIAAIQILLLYLLVPRYGLIGAASATTIACFVGLIPLLWKSYRYKLGLSFNHRMIFSYGLLAVLLYFFPYYNGRIQTVLVMLAAGLAYLVSLVLFRLITREDMRIMLSGIFPRENFITKRLLARVGFMDSLAEKDDA